MSAILEIEKEQDNYAHTIASKLNASIGRKIGMIDILGITIFMKYLKKHHINPRLSNCLHNFPFALEEYKITDVSYNGHKIFVVTVFRENYIRIPKIHFELGIEPDFYVITEVNKNIEKGAIGGFIKAEDVLSSIYDDKFYYPQKKDISKIEEFLDVIKTSAQPKKTLGKHLEASAMFVKLAEGELNKHQKDKLIKHLLTCENCAIKLKDFLQFDNALSPEVNFLGASEKLDKKQFQKNLKVEIKPAPKIEITPVIKPAEANLYKNLEEINPIKSYFEPVIEKPMGKRETIDFIFKGKNVFDINFSKINIKNLQEKKKILVAIGICAILVFFLGVGAIVKKTSQTLKPIEAYDNVITDEINTESDFYNSQDYYTSENPTSLDYSLVNNADAKSSIVSVKNVSWEVDKEFANKENYTKFLQIVGKNIKLNLQNELLVATDFATNSIIRADIRFSSNGNVGNLKIVNGSGSEQIDEIIQKCVYETLSYIKPPSSGLIGKNLEMTLVIEL